MTRLIIFFSLTGNNKRIAEEIAQNEKCDIFEFSPGNMLRVFQFFSRRKKLAKKARELNNTIVNHDELIILGPIWARKPAPAVQVLLKNLDLKGKKIRCYLTYSDNYKDSEAIINELISHNSGKLEEIKFIEIPKKVKLK